MLVGRRVNQPEGEDVFALTLKTELIFALAIGAFEGLKLRGLCRGDRETGQGRQGISLFFGGWGVVTGRAFSFLGVRVGGVGGQTGGREKNSGTVE